MEFTLKSCHFIALAAILLLFSDRALCAGDKRRGAAAADARKNQLDKKGGVFTSDVMHDGSGGAMSADIDWDGSGRGPDDEDDDEDVNGRGSGHGAHDTETQPPRPAVHKHFDNDDEDGLPSGDISDDLPHSTTTTATMTTTQEPTTTTTTRRRPDPPTEPIEIFEEPDEPVTEVTSTRAPSSTAPKEKSTPPPTTIYDIGDRRTLDPFLRPGILAAVIGGAVVGLLAAILLVMFIVYRMRKKDEGSYALDEPKQPPHYSYAYQKAPTKEFYA